MPVQHTRYAFIDLDALVASVKRHVETHPQVFASLLERMAVADIAIDPERLTALLDAHGADDDTHFTVACRRGSYYKPYVPYASAFTACGWDMKKKGAASHRTLENLLTRARQDAGAAPPDSSHVQTLVLATGAVTPSILSLLETFAAAHWRVELFCLAHCEHTSGVAQLCETYAAQTAVIHIDNWLNDVLVDCKQLAVRSHGEPSPAPSPPSSAIEPSATAPRRPSVHATPTSATAAAMKEQSIAAKKTRALQATPSQYSAGTRQRFVFMDFDNVTASLYSSHRLYQRVSGARNARDLYVNLQALTARIGGDDAARVALQLATYYNSSEAMAQSLRTYRWQVQKQETVSDTTLQLELYSHLVASPDRSKTLVLVTGDGNVAANNKSFTAIVERYLQQNWFVEIHAWVHALSESYIDFQRAYPQHVVVRPLDAVFHDLVSLKTNVHTTAASGAGASPLPVPVAALASLSTSSSCSRSEPAAVVPALAPVHIQKLQDAFAALRLATVERGELPAQVLACRSSSEQVETANGEAQV